MIYDEFILKRTTVGGKSRALTDRPQNGRDVGKEGRKAVNKYEKIAN